MEKVTERLQAMRILAALLLIMFLGVDPAFSTDWDTFRCKNGLVSRNDTMAEVIKKCGQPSLTNKREETYYRSGALIIYTVEEWTYNEGPNEFMYLLRFENGRVARIESLDTGF